ncbi:DUF3298 and DUF4163 domain-containing protein [Microbulbifer taiwanensis]|uniref:DUF3298 domain-containing protein n=1 Tax=Microbulbifer taiwanensis TaxID=986746 RepID=A0ABW1YQ67_9GAMM|nr:DUF3298 and DUF4163 domain-containing protein [Microbulbifer taiwanensis]
MQPGRIFSKSIVPALFLGALVSLSGCGGEREAARNDATIGKLDSRLETLERRASNCAAGRDCASVSISREVFEQRPALNKAVLRLLVRQLQGNGEDQTSASSLEEIADIFLAEAAQMEEISSAVWQLTGEARRLSRRGKLLTVEINSYRYTGGAHGMPSVHWLNWNLSSAEQVSLEQVIGDGKEKRFWKEAQAAHRRWQDKQPGSNRDFRQMWPFQRSEDFRLDDEGLVLLYNVYTLGPYVLGPVQLTIPWKDLRDVVREQYQPASAPDRQRK